MPDPIHAIVHLRAEGVSVLVDLTAGRLPSILHWGGDLGALAAEDAPALLASAIRPLASNIVDPPIRAALLPEHRTGWLGRPGLSGSRAGRDWSPDFRVTRAELDGQQIEPTADLTLISAGSGTLVVEASDDVARLRLEVRIELAPAGLLRSQAEVTNLADEAYTVNDCVIAYPGAAGRPGDPGLRRPLGQGAGAATEHARDGHPSA